MKMISSLLLMVLAACISSGVCAQKNNPGTNGAANGQPFQSLQDQIDAAKAQLDALAAGNEEAIAQIQSDILNLQNQTADLQIQISSNIGDISTLNAEVVLLQDLVAMKQDVLDGSCAAGSSLRVINPDGSVICEFDDVGSPYVSIVDVNSPFYPVAPIGGTFATNYGYPTFTTMIATCPAGYTAIGGGAQLWKQGAGLENQGIITETRPEGLSGWRASAEMSPSASPSSLNAIMATARCVLHY